MSTVKHSDGQWHVGGAVSKKYPSVHMAVLWHKETSESIENTKMSEKKSTNKLDTQDQAVLKNSEELRNGSGRPRKQNLMRSFIEFLS